MAPKNGTIPNLLTSTPWRADAFLSAFLIQNQGPTAETADPSRRCVREDTEKADPVLPEVTSAISACSAVKGFLWGIPRHPVLLRAPPIGGPKLGALSGIAVFHRLLRKYLKVTKG